MKHYLNTLIVLSFIAISISLFAPRAQALIITDGDFSTWSFGSSGTISATVTRELSGGNPGARLNNTTNTGLGDTAFGTAIKSDFSTFLSLEGTPFGLQLDVLRGPGAGGDGQSLNLLVEQGSSIYRLEDGVTGVPDVWTTITFNGTLTGSTFKLLEGVGPATPDFSGGTETFFGFSGSNTNSGQLTMYYDNFSLEIEPTEPIPEPATVALLGIGLAGLAGVGARRKWKKKAVDKYIKTDT